MTETACPKVKQHIGLAADSDGAIHMVLNHLMTSTYHKMGEDEANDQIGNMNIEENDWNDEWGPKETYFAKKKQWETDEAATEPAAASWGRDDDWHGWDDQAGPYGKGKGKGSKGKGKKGKGGKGGGDRGGGGGQEVTQSIVDLVAGMTAAVANQNQQNPPPMQLQLANNNALAAVGQGGVATRSNINLIIENISRCYICCSLEASFSC